jgi:hypothetical protein
MKCGLLGSALLVLLLILCSRAPLAQSLEEANRLYKAGEYEAAIPALHRLAEEGDSRA